MLRLCHFEKTAVNMGMAAHSEGRGRWNSEYGLVYTASSRLGRLQSESLLQNKIKKIVVHFSLKVMIIQY